MICYIEQNYCECGAFQADIYPYSYIIAVSSHVHISPYQYVDNVYKTSFKHIWATRIPLAVRKSSLKGVDLLLFQMNPKYVKRVNQSLRR